MKKSVINDIFHGFRGDMETMNRTNSEESSKIVCQTYDELKEKLSPEMFTLHQKLVDALEDDWAEAVDFYFAEGFKLGLAIGVECMED